MNTLTDAELLRRFAESESQDAFAELVRRRIGFVYAAALRQVGNDAHRAEDVTQEVFIDLARKAASLCRHPALLGWLYTSTHFAAAKMTRAEQRRKTREEKVHAMHEISATPGSETDWDRVRPVLDQAMHELNERDRQTVLLRFFDQQTFAAIGHQLGLSENAAQKSVERALDKLHAVLTRRGVTSTSTALSLALVNQAGIGAPAGLAEVISATACAGAAAAGHGAIGVGVLTFMSANKIVIGAASLTVTLAIATSVLQRSRARDAEAALSVAEQAHQALSEQLAATDERLRRAEQRAAQAEKESGELSQTLATARAEHAAALSAARSAPTHAPADRAADNEEERRAYLRAFHQNLARHRAASARFRANFEADIAQLPPVLQFQKRIEAAAQFAENAEFQEAIHFYNRAMESKPADAPVSDQVRQLQSTLEAQRTPVEVTFTSDARTWVAIDSDRMLEQFDGTTVKLPPGNYVVTGQRAGYQDVRLPIEVRNGAPPPVVSVVCTLPTN